MSGRGGITVDARARGLFELLTAEDPWIVRRRDSFSLVDDELLVGTHTVDFRKPPVAHGKRAELPLFVLPKAPSSFSQFDLNDESGKSYHLPTLNENARTSACVLLYSARRRLSDSTLGASPLTSRQEEALCRAAVESDVAKISTKRDEFTESLTEDQKRSLKGDLYFPWLLDILTRASLVAITIDFSDRPIRMLKLSFTRSMVHIQQKFLVKVGWKPQPLGIDIPYARAESFHTEVTAPEGMQIIYARLRASLVGKNDGPSEEETQEDTGRKRRVHLYMSDSTLAKSAGFYAEMRVRRSAFAGGAVIASTAVAIALTFCAFSVGPISKTNASAPPMLLLLPGLIAALVSRPGLHPMTSRLLNRARFMLVGSAGLAFVGALIVGIQGNHWSEEILRICLFGLGVSGWAIAFAMFQTWRLPVPSEDPNTTFLRLVSWLAEGGLARALGLSIDRSPFPVDPWIHEEGPLLKRALARLRAGFKPRVRR